MLFLSNKRGSYIAEAAMVLPILILAMVCLLSVVSVYAVGENVFFSTCDELIFAESRAALVKDSASLPIASLARAKLENSEITYVLVTDYGYLHEEGMMKDLISIEISGGIKIPGPFSWFGSTLFSEAIRGRAFTGLYKPTPTGDNMEEGELELVYVFPMRGEKYHNRECAFLNPACQRVFLTKDIQNRFKACSICKSGETRIGENVFCFFNTGNVYHTGKCSQVDKYFVEIDKRDALSQGYMPCAACGG